MYGYENFFNRDYSWLQFNTRVLEEAEKDSNPLFEKLKFLAISSSNLDEFFMIRVSGLIAQIRENYDKLEISGKSPLEQIKEIQEKISIFSEKQDKVYTKLKGFLEEEKVFLSSYNDLYFDVRDGNINIMVDKNLQESLELS